MIEGHTVLPLVSLLVQLYGTANSVATLLATQNGCSTLHAQKWAESNNLYKLKPIANKESLTHPDSTMGSGPSFSVASHGSRV